MVIKWSHIGNWSNSVHEPWTCNKFQTLVFLKEITKANLKTPVINSKKYQN